MTRKSKTALVVLCIVFAVLLAALLLLILLPKGDGSSETIVQFESVSSIAFDGGSGQTYEYETEDGTWICTLDHTVPLNQNIFTRITGYLKSLTSLAEMEISDTLEAYGLSDPAMTFSAKSEDGTSIYLLIGNNAGEDGYYAMENGGDKIYILESAFVDSISYDLFALVEKEEIQALAADNITGIRLTYDGTQASFIREDDGWYMDTENGFIKEEDYSAPDSLGETHTVRKYINDIENSLSSIKASLCIDYNGLMGADYGFDTGLTAEFDLSTGDTVTFYVGDSFRTEDTDQYFYFTLPGYSGVYAMTGSPGNALYEAAYALGD